MRKAFSNYFIIKDEKTVYGISLGYDFCSEHEWGNDGMKRYFGIDSDKMGVDGRTNTKGEVYVFENKTHILLRSTDPGRWNNKKKISFKDALPYESININEELTTYWDEREFCVVLTKTEENVTFVRDIEQAVKNNDLVIGYIKSEVPVFSNSSLCLTIRSRLPKEITDQMYAVDKKKVDLDEYEEKIGVKTLKEKFGKKNGYKGEKYYCACSPRWVNYEDAEDREKQKNSWNTKYDIMYWVNYSDDDDNYGWYTVEQIIKWLSTPGLKLKSLNKNDKK